MLMLLQMLMFRSCHNHDGDAPADNDGGDGDGDEAGDDGDDDDDCDGGDDNVPGMATDGDYQ